MFSIVRRGDFSREVGSSNFQIAGVRTVRNAPMWNIFFYERNERAGEKATSRASRLSSFTQGRETEYGQTRKWQGQQMGRFRRRCARASSDLNKNGPRQPGCPHCGGLGVFEYSVADGIEYRQTTEP